MTNGNGNGQSWKVLSRRPLLSAPPWLEVVQETVQLPSGRVLPDFYQIELPEFAAVVPITTDGRFVLVRGYKHGVRQVTLSAPAGLLESGEDPLQCAQRELQEETGYTTEDWWSLGCYAVDGNRKCGRMHLFLARDVQQAGAPREDDAESLDLVLLTEAEVRRSLKSGQFRTLAGASAIAIGLAWV